MVAEEIYGDIPDKMVVMHICDNRWCINPDHLRIATQSENLKDMYNKGRQGIREFPKGEKHHTTTLTQTQVDEIRVRARKGLFRKLAKEFKVSKTTIANIHYNKTWK